MKLAAPAQKLRTTRTQDVLPVEFSWTPQYAGEYKISIEVEPLEGELITTNNVLTTFVTVLKGGLSVAYFDIWRPEIGKLKRGRPVARYSNRPSNRPLSRRSRTPQKSTTTGSIRENTTSTSSATSRPRCSANETCGGWRKRSGSGAGLIMTGGFHSFGAGGYATTPLQDLLPVVMYPTEILNEDELDESLQIDEPVQMLPTTEGRGDFVMRMGEHRRRLGRVGKNSPNCKGRRNSRPKSLGLARVLAESESQQPLLIAQEYNPGRVMAFRRRHHLSVVSGRGSPTNISSSGGK